MKTSEPMCSPSYANGDFAGIAARFEKVPFDEKFFAHHLRERGQILSSYDSFVVADDDDYDGVDHHEVDQHDLHQVRSL